MTLDELRTTLTELDEQLLGLVARRQALSEQVAAVKRASGRATRTSCGNGRSFFAAERRTATGHFAGSGRIVAAAVDPVVAGDQEHARVAAHAHGSGKRALVIGGCGKMGGWFSEFLASQGFRWPYPTRREAWRASTGSTGGRRCARFRRHRPRHSAGRHVGFAGVARQTRASGLIFDLGSLKTPLRAGLEALVKAGCRVTSLHPMFGPDTELLSGDTSFSSIWECGCIAGSPGIVRTDHGRTVIMDLDEHDRLVAYVLGLSHALNIAFFTALAESGEAAMRLGQLSSTTFDSQLEVASRVAAESPELYFEIQSLNEYAASRCWL